MSQSNADGSTPNAATTQKQLPDVMRIDRSDKDFASRAYSRVSLPAGSVFYPFDVKINSSPTWATVQMSETTHGDLQPSELTFINHSCSPSVEFDTAKKIIRVVRDRDLKEGDELTTFYPSHEWSMSQPFDCWCGTAACVGNINGAKEMNIDLLKKYWLNNHIERLLDEKKYGH